MEQMTLDSNFSPVLTNKATGRFKIGWKRGWNYVLRKMGFYSEIVARNELKNQSCWIKT